MTTKARIAIVYPGNYEARQNATPENNRFAALFQALADLGIHAEPAVYHPDFWQEVYSQLLEVDAVLVWVNPIQDGHTRTVLDAMLRDISKTGIFVSAHPDVILKMGTKEVLYQTRHFTWGCDTHIYPTIEALHTELPTRLGRGEIRVLKQYRGNNGWGVWKVEAFELGNQTLQAESLVRVRHAERGSPEEVMPLGRFLQRCEQYFVDGGKLIDQIYQARLPEGMIRSYMVHGTVAGFGHQAINALYPIASNGDIILPSERYYHPPTMPDFQALKEQLETAWIPALQDILDIPTDSLPIIWDADFLLGEKDARGQDTYVLCEINVSSVAPYPESAIPYMAEAALSHAEKLRQ